MEEYLEKIKVKLDIDPKTMEDVGKLQAKLEGIAEDKKIKWDFNADDIEGSIKSLYRKYKYDPINPRQWARAFGESARNATGESAARFLTGSTSGEITKENIAANAVGKTRDAINKGFSSLIGVNKSGFAGLVDITKDAWRELQSLVSYSKLSTKDVREQMFQYGFTFAENYAFDKTMDLLGLNDIEDVWYLNAQEEQKFREKFAEYTDRYNQLYDQGFFEEMEEYNWEMQEFKEDLRYSVIKWMVDNKDLIKTGMEAIMSIAKFILKIISFLGGSSEETVENAEIASNTSYQYGDTKNINVEVGGVTANYGMNNAGYLPNPAEMTYKQIIQVLTPGRYAY